MRPGWLFLRQASACGVLTDLGQVLAAIGVAALH